MLGLGVPWGAAGMGLRAGSAQGPPAPSLCGGAGVSPCSTEQEK